MDIENTDDAGILEASLTMTDAECLSLRDSLDQAGRTDISIALNWQIISRMEARLVNHHNDARLSAE
jgi:hypothetical protein